METSTKFELATSLRGSRFEPSRAGAALSLMLLWSQTPASRLKGLPSFKDASAEFMLGDPSRIVRSLIPEVTDDLVSGLAAHRSSELESLRRTVMNALDARVPADAIADAILALCAPYSWLSSEASSILMAALGAKKGARIKCAFSLALRTAWTLSKTSVVDLDVEDATLVPVLSMLAVACGRSLQVQVNSIESLYRQQDRLGRFHHALIFPPIGMRLKLDHGDQLGSEAFGALWGAHLGSGRNIVVVGNGLLFRTSSRDAAFKQDLIHSHGLEAVLSLPRGALPGSSVAMSALIFYGEARPKHPSSIRFVDGSDPTALDPYAIGDLIDSEASHPMCADASFEELGGAGFSLSVDRYVLDTDTRRNREILERQETARLSDLADIRRPQALPREPGKESTFEVREALLADIDNGRLFLPTKLSELPRSAAAKIEGAVLKPGDILLSIKGTIGKAALVTEDALAESSPVPIVPGQSFVIVRIRKGSLIRDPRVLLSYLRSPVAQSMLLSIAGGTTISNVAMGALKEMPIPIPNPKVQDEMLKKIDQYNELLRDMDVLQNKLSDMENEIFSLTLKSK